MLRSFALEFWNNHIIILVSAVYPTCTTRSKMLSMFYRQDGRLLLAPRSKNQFRIICIVHGGDVQLLITNPGTTYNI